MTVSHPPPEPDDEPFEEPPRAPTQAAWDAMSAAERDAAVEALPDYIPWEEIGMPEGDPHFDAKDDGRDVIRRFFQQQRRSVYVSAELAVYYPDEKRFSPDLLVVLDIDPHPRMKWVVSAEGKGLDWALEVAVASSSESDRETNKSRYARLGIPEYFVYDHRRSTVRGWHLPPGGARTYVPITPRAGRVPSEVLGLELAAVGERLRFYLGNTEIQPSREILDVLEARIDELHAALDGVRLRAVERRTRADEERSRADAAEARVRALETELARLRGGT